MFNQLLELLPEDPGRAMQIAAGSLTLIGLLLWLAGSRINRSAVTLSAVTIGALAGLELPKLLGWEISGMGPAVGGAVILGTLGFVLHRLGAGLIFGLVLALWAGALTWHIFGPEEVWNLPAPTEQVTPQEYVQSVWISLPPDFRHIAPYACLAAIVVGVACAILWPVLTTVSAWSALGTTLLLLGSTSLAYLTRPELLGHIPQGPWPVGSLIAGIFLLGVLIQWKLTSRKPSPLPKRSDLDSG